MRRFRSATWLLFGVLGLLASAPGRAATWVEPSTTKVLPGSAPSGVDRADLSAVRGEWVAFQVVIAGDGVPLLGVDGTLTDLAGPGDAVIPGASAERYREYYVDLTGFNSPCQVLMNPECDAHPEYLRTPGFYPEPLIPFRDPYGDDPQRPVGAPFDVAADGRQVVFVDLPVPLGIPAGIYGGTFVVTSASGAVASLPVSLEVLDADLPARRTVATAFNFSTSALQDFHGGPDGGDETTRERFFRNYELEIHKHRVDFSRTGPRVTFAFDADGALVPPDYAAYDAYWEPRVSGARFPDGAGQLRWDLGMFKPGAGLGSLTEAQYAAAVKDLAAHLQAKGFLDHVYMYGSDEPWLPEKRASGSYANITADVARLRAATDLFRGKVMTTSPWQQEMDDSIDIWCPDTAMYGHVFWPEGTWAEPGKYRELRAAGRELWFYVCNQNFPPLMGYDADTPFGHEPRLLKWGAWYEGATGFLYWRMTYWMEPDPWNVLADVPEFGPEIARNGDGILVYPGDHDGRLGQDPPAPWPPIDGPLPSLRLKQIRDGMEDWELFKQVAEAGGEAFTRAQVERVYRRFGDTLDLDFDPSDRPWSLDGAEVIDARRQVALKLQYLRHPDLYPDPEVPVVVEGADTVPDAPQTDIATPDLPSTDLSAQDLPSTDVPAPDTPSSDFVADVPPADVPSTDTGKATSSGCAAGPAGSLPALLLPLLLAALALARSRRPAR